ncbi:MAG: VOC family protein [Thermoleophilia bacterium]|nr:VOC family protein [Thermoleophilia bacterium]MDQ3859149.1 VOC family protein [Actinomycetota bacterium]
MSVWYGVTDLERARAFYTEKLGFRELYRDAEGKWMRLVRDGAELAVAETPDRTGAVLAIDVDDVKAEAERLRREGIDVGVVVEIHGTIRLLDVFDPDGNRLQLTQDL